MIQGFTGRLGTGKTYGMVYAAMQWMRKYKLPVYTNMEELKFPSSIYINSIMQIPDLEAGLLLLDEAAVLLNARRAMSNPLEVLSHFRQSRKVALDLYYTSQGSEDVDKTLRDLTNQIVCCSKLRIPFRQGAYFLHTTVDPTDKAILGRRPIPLHPDVAALYDTDEKIQRGGGSAGIGAAAALLQQGRRVASRPPLQEASWQAPCRAMRHYDDFAWLSPAAQEAAEYLEIQGRLHRGVEGWMLRVQTELKRRRWLALFDLTAENVPWYTTPGNPWVVTQCPTMVRHRQRQDEEQDAEEILIRRERSKQRR